MIEPTHSVRCILLFVLPLGLLACGSSGDGDDDTQVLDPPEPVSLISKNTLGFQGDASTQDGRSSSDGRYVAFSSDSTNLVAGDGNTFSDIFVHDTRTGETTRISVDSLGNESNGDSYNPQMSGDGRYVVFSSNADNLVAADANANFDIFLHDRQSGETTRISVDSMGNEANASSSSPRISANARYAAFSSGADNLVAGDANTVNDVFLRDLQSGAVTRISVGPMGVEANAASGVPAISANAGWVAFRSVATNLVAGDNNSLQDVFVHDTQTGVTERVSLGPGGLEGDGRSNDPEISDDGRYIAFYSDATNFVAGDNNGVEDIFRHDRTTGMTIRVSIAADDSEGDDASDTLAMSGDGRYVAFYSDASNLVSNDTNAEPDTFVRDTQANTTKRVSVASDGSQADDSSAISGMSRDGRYVFFYSKASNLDPAANNGNNQLFRAPAY